MEKRQCIEMKINNDEDGVFAMSIVESPAIEKNFVYLSKEIISLKLVDEEQGIIVGIALTPNKKIPRRTKNGTMYDIFFTNQTVATAAEMFMKNLKGNSFTINHNEETSDVSVMESWIVEDPNNDKSNIYNLEASEGDWCLKARVSDPKLKEKIKAGKINGYSLEGKFFSETEVIEPTKDTEELQAIKELLNNF
jgi:hypothetical protein